MIKIRPEHDLWQNLYMSRLMTKSTKWLCAQRRLRSAWASAQSDQSDQSLRMKKAWVLSYPLSASEDSDQTGRMPRLICLRWSHSHFVSFVMSRLIRKRSLQSPEKKHRMISETVPQNKSSSYLVTDHPYYKTYLAKWINYYQICQIVFTMTCHVSY